MGNCTCIRDNQLIADIPDNTSKGIVLDEIEKGKLLEKAKKFQPRVIKLQAYVRGFLCRKKIPDIVNEHYKMKVSLKPFLSLT